MALPERSFCALAFAGVAQATTYYSDPVGKEAIKPENIEDTLALLNAMSPIPREELPLTVEEGLVKGTPPGFFASVKSQATKLIGETKTLPWGDVLPKAVKVASPAAKLYLAYEAFGILKAQLFDGEVSPGVGYESTANPVKEWEFRKPGDILFSDETGNITTQEFGWQGSDEVWSSGYITNNGNCERRIFASPGAPILYAPGWIDLPFPGYCGGTYKYRNYVVWESVDFRFCKELELDCPKAYILEPGTVESVEEKAAIEALKKSWNPETTRMSTAGRMLKKTRTTIRRQLIPSQKNRNSIAAIGALRYWKTPN